MKRYKFIFDAKKQTVVNNLMNGVISADFSEKIKLFEKDAIYGRVSKNKICLYHGTPFRTYLRPVFSAKIIESEKTTLSGVWRLPVHINIFFILWYLFLIFVSIIPLITKGEKNLPLLYATVVVFAFLGVAFIISGYWIERKRMMKVIEHIRTKQKELDKNNK